MSGSPSPGRGPLKRPQGEQTTRRLLDAALAVHAEHGDEGFTVQAVLDRTGISLGSLYHHFGSVHGLRAALYSDCLGRLLEAVHADVRRARTAKGGVRALVQSYIRFTTQHPAASRYVHASSYATYRHEHAAAIEADVGPTYLALRAWFRPHVQSGRIVDVGEPLLEVLLMGPVAEICRRWLAGATDADLDAAARRLPERTWAAVRGDVP